MSYDDQDDESVFLYHTQCPDCGSSDANGVYSDGHMYCFACDPSVAWKKGDMELTEGYTPSGGRKQVSNLLTFGENAGRYVPLPAVVSAWRYARSTATGWATWVARWFRSLIITTGPGPR